jgi:hypothetical protein
MTRPVVLWATPRSVSTAFARAFMSHPEISVVLEPFTDVYYFGPDRVSCRYGDATGCADRTAAAVRREVLASEGPTLIKEMSYQAAQYLGGLLPQVTSSFMIREPVLVARSLAKLRPDFNEEELGFETLWRIWKEAQCFPGSPVVVDGERFRHHPESVLRNYCKQVGLPYSPRMLRWQPGPIKRWCPHERRTQVRWHSAVESSDGVKPPALRLAVTLPETAVLGRARVIYEELVRYAI